MTKKEEAPAKATTKVTQPELFEIPSPAGLAQLNAAAQQVGDALRDFAKSAVSASSSTDTLKQFAAPAAEPDNVYPIAALTAAQIVRLAQILTTPATKLSDALVKVGAVHKADRGRLPGNEPDEPDEPQEPELA